jgi:electron transport complex protein RnfG
MRKFLIPVLSLLVAATVLLAGFNLLLPVKEKVWQQELQEKMLTLLPGSVSFTQEEYTGDDANIRAVYKAENGYVVLTATQGYVDQIAVLVGVSNQGKVTGLQVRASRETAGLGGEALTDVEFLKQFLNTDGSAAVGETVDALTGATVTSKAITRCVNSAVGFVTGADTSSGATSWG